MFASYFFFKNPSNADSRVQKHHLKLCIIYLSTCLLVIFLFWSEISNFHFHLILHIHLPNLSILPLKGVFLPTYFDFHDASHERIF